jgi:hypothetical protein
MARLGIDCRAEGGPCEALHYSPERSREVYERANLRVLA